ncbi:hypothetical protein [Halalkalibacter flavus]|uniref:hypothetical protein n=1 Tax=Halalkalibacter flavus TaxID=3090668 RepID=UPI002FCAF2F2
MKTRLKALYNNATESIYNSITKKYVIIFALTFIIPTFLIYQLIIGYPERMVERDIIIMWSHNYAVSNLIIVAKKQSQSPFLC